MPEPIDVATTFLRSWAAADMDAAAPLLAEDVRFEGPMRSAQGREEVATAMAEFAALVSGITVIAAVGDGERALVMYDMHTRPFGTLRAAEHYVVRDGRIVSDQLVFDTHPVRGTA